MMGAVDRSPTLGVDAQALPDSIRVATRITEMRYSLRARISTANPDAVESALARMFPHATMTRSEDTREFVVEAVLDGSSARDMNRALLSELRRVERRTRLRSEWTCKNTTERFFDYVPKGARKA
jgi:hypothetical protein